MEQRASSIVIGCVCSLENLLPQLDLPSAFSVFCPPRLVYTERYLSVSVYCSWPGELEVAPCTPPPEKADLKLHIAQCFHALLWDHTAAFAHTACSSCAAELTVLLDLKKVVVFGCSYVERSEKVVCGWIWSLSKLLDWAGG